MLHPGDHVLDHVDPYLHDLLSSIERERLEQHVDSCRICQVALEEARKRLVALQAVPVVEAPEWLLQRTEETIRNYRPPRWNAARIALLTGVTAAAILAGMHMHYLGMAASPYDLRVLGQSEVLAGADGSLRVVVVRPGDGVPVAGVPVEVELASSRGANPIRLASFRTDATGTGAPQFRWPEWDPGDYVLRITARPGSDVDDVRRTVKLKRAWKLMVSSDKPVYQPGQTIRLRSLALRRPDSKPVAGQEAVFSIADPKGNVIFRRRGVTSRFGISSADCPLADEIIEGAYRVACEIGDTRSEIAVEVERYVLPKIKLTVEFDKPYWQPGERVSGRVTATYFFGKPVDGGEVRIDVDSQPFAGAEIRSPNVRTDGTGRANFDFVLPERLRPSLKETGAGPVAVTVTVRDSAGQEQTKTESCAVATQAIRIEVIPEAGTLITGVPNRVYLLTTYPDGRPAPARVAVSGEAEEVVTDESGAGMIELASTPHSLQWTLRAVDREGREGRREVTLLGESFPGDFLVRTDKATYRGGETLRASALGTSGNAPVFIDLVKDGQTVLTHAVAMSKGRGEGEIDLPAGLFGTIELRAYRFSESGTPIRKRRILYVERAQELRIDVARSRPEYRPGEQARLQLRLTGRDGRAVPGAISLSAVDEAVFSVLDRKPGSERSYFNVDSDLLKPVLASAWAPGAFANLPAARKARFEQAVFSRAAGGDASDREALERKPEFPNAWSLAQNGSRSELVDQLRGDRVTHTLSASTYPEKAMAVEAKRRGGLNLVEWLWCVLGVCSVVVFLICTLRRFWEVIVVVFVILILMALMLPAVHRARVTAGARLFLSARLAMEKELAVANPNDAMNFLKTGGESGAQNLGYGPPRLRHWFPETLLWRPEVITDDNGEVAIDVDLADSITTWRVSASAVSAAGELGAVESAIRVFQPFFVDLNLPVALTRGDAVTVPVVVYNYLDRPQTVELILEEEGAFELAGPARQIVELAAGEVKSVGYPMRARRVGRPTLRVTARAGEFADAIKRTVEVVSDGRKSEQVASGNLAEPARVAVAIADDAIEGSVKGILKIYPSSFSQVVEGLESVFQQPYGCFEQTSSTTYPNILALDYLTRTKKNAPDVEARARQFIHLGYQRLLTFEIAGGGFDWFGHPPANRVLSAYGLMEFEDMARVHDIDRAVIERTRKWLLAQQRSDGTWDPDGHGMHEDPTGGAGKLARIGTTAYIAWALFGGDSADRGSAPARKALDFLKSHDPGEIDDPYALALIVSAIAAIDRSSDAAESLLARLEGLKQVSADGKRVWWEGKGGDRTLFHGGGISRRVETTALVSLAMLRSPGRHAATLRGALTWLVEQKDPRGTWHSTQATVLALKALLAAAGRPQGDDIERRIDLALDGRPLDPVIIPRDQSDVMQQIDLSSRLTPGAHEVTIADRQGGSMTYQLAVSHHTPAAPSSTRPDSLSVALTFDRTNLRIGQSARAEAIVRNDSAAPAPMVLVELPVPAGFDPSTGAISQLIEAGKVEKVQTTARSIIVYLRSLAAGQSLTIPYELRATLAVDLTAPPAVAWEYYEPEISARSAVARLTVSE